MGVVVAALFVAGVGAASTRPTATRLPLSPALGAGFDLSNLVVGGAESLAEPVVVPAAAAPAPPPPPPVVQEVVIAPPPPVFDAPPPPPPPPPPALVAPVQPAAPTTGTWAVIVGINDYPGSRSDLRSAVNDADTVDAALAGLGVPVDNRLVLRNGQASADRIRQAVDWLVSRAGPDAAGVFFYAGHVRKTGATSEALVGADGTLLSDRELGERLSHLRARRAWVAIAACYGAGFTEVLAPGRVLTGAAAADALAYETSALNRSYMVEFMVQRAIIERRAPDSVQSAFAFAVTELTRTYPGRQPVQIDTGLGPLDLRPAVAAASGPIPGQTPVTVPPTPPPTVPCRQLLLFACR